MNQSDICKVIDRYAVANGEKNTLAKEVSELGKAIKGYFTARGLAIFNTTDNVAIINYRKSRTLDTEKLAAHFGGVIPEKFYTEKETPTLLVKARTTAKAVENATAAA